MKLSELLKKIKDNPDDLSVLVDAINQATEMERNDTDQLEQIGKLQENYRKVLKLVPVPDDKPPEDKPEDKPPTIDDAVNEIRAQMKGE